MLKFRTFLANIAFAVGLAVSIIGVGAAGGALLAGCGTGSAGADPSASTPATSHYKADLAVGYGALEVIDVGTKNALNAGAITVDQAVSVRTQRKAFKAALDSLAAAGASAGNQTTLSATLAAITAAQAFVAISQGVKK